MLSLARGTLFRGSLGRASVCAASSRFSSLTTTPPTPPSSSSSASFSSSSSSASTDLPLLGKDGEDLLGSFLDAEKSSFGGAISFDDDVAAAAGAEAGAGGTGKGNDAVVEGMKLHPSRTFHPGDTYTPSELFYDWEHKEPARGFFKRRLVVDMLREQNPSVRIPDDITYKVGDYDEEGL